MALPSSGQGHSVGEAPVFRAPVCNPRDRNSSAVNLMSLKFHDASSGSGCSGNTGTPSTPTAMAADPYSTAFQGLLAYSAGLAQQVQHLDGQLQAYAAMVYTAQVELHEMTARLAEQEAKQRTEREQLAEARRLIALHEERARKSAEGDKQHPSTQENSKPQGSSQFSKKRKSGPARKKWTEIGEKQKARRRKELQKKLQEFRDQLQKDLDPDLEVREIIVEPRSQPDSQQGQTAPLNTGTNGTKADAGEQLSYKVGKDGIVNWRRVRKEAKRFQKRINKEYYKKYGRLPQHTQVTPQQLCRIQRLLAAKDAGKMSDRQYAKLAMADPGMERLHRLKKERAKQNEEIDILEMDGAFDGHRRKVSDLLHYIMDMEEIKKLYEDMEQPKIKLRLAIDGRRTSNSGVKTVMTVFSLLDEAAAGRCAQEHQYCIALYDGGEEHEELKESLVEVFEELESLEEEGFQLGDTHYDFEYYLCSDWKMLANLLGINQANSDYFCLWCDCYKPEQIFDMTVEDWKITRSYDQCRQRCTMRRKEDARGCKFCPLIKLDFSKVIPDTLHLHLRVGGAIIHGIIEWAVNNDKRDELLTALADCGVRLNIREEKQESGASRFTYPSMDGNNIKRILQAINLDFVADGNQRQKTECCISKFNELMSALTAERTSPAYIEPDQFQKKARSFINSAREVFFDEDITPYMHTLAYHVPQFLKLYGTIYQFNCQPVEKKNHAQNCSFHRTTQHGGLGSSYTQEVMKEENRHLFQRKTGLLAELEPRRREKPRRDTQKLKDLRKRMQQRAEDKRKKLSVRIAERLKKKAKRGKKKALSGRKIKVKAV